MSDAREAARKGLELGIAAVNHAGWWLRWQTDHSACREVRELGFLAPPTADAEQPAA
jgi:hypothetical protein